MRRALVRLTRIAGGYTALAGRAQIRRAYDGSAGRGTMVPRGWLLTLDGEQTSYSTLSDARERLDAEAAYESSQGRVA